MLATELFSIAVEMKKDDMVRIMKDLTDEELYFRPRFDCNSIIWTAWHLTREFDFHINSFTGRPHVWIEEGWHERFGREADPTDRGLGHTPEQVAAFRATDVETVINYYDAVLKRALEYVASLTPEDLDRELDEPQRWRLPITVGIRMAGVLDELSKHLGQMAYLRGLFQGRGWQRF